MRSVRARASLGLVTLGAAAALFLTPDTGAATRLGGAPPLRLDRPQASEIAAYGRIRDASPTRRLGVVLPPAWGGRYTTAGGESVTIYSSNSYVEDQAANQRWADFLGRLTHGSELSSVTLFLATLREVESVCGRFAAACYSPRESLIVAPGEDLPEGITSEAVVTHEYGHHVAANRINPPWDALDFGTKRWASWENVCAGAAAGTLFPGNESGDYDRNPGEAFAETFRVLNERRAGLPETPWSIVTTSLYPDETALSLIQRDVLDPWRSNSASVVRGTLRRVRVSRSFLTQTTHDGVLTVTLRAPARSRYAIALYRGAGRIGRAVTTASSRVRTVSTTVCGTRTHRVNVTRVAGSGEYSVSVSKP